MVVVSFDATVSKHQCKPWEHSVCLHASNWFVRDYVKWKVYMFLW